MPVAGSRSIRAASIAATVELSTPPLIATAMGRFKVIDSGMRVHRRGNLAEVSDTVLDRVNESVHLLAGVGAAEREPNAAGQGDGPVGIRRGRRR